MKYVNSFFKFCNVDEAISLAVVAPLQFRQSISKVLDAFWLSAELNNSHVYAERIAQIFTKLNQVLSAGAQPNRFLASVSPHGKSFNPQLWANRQSRIGGVLRKKHIVFLEALQHKMGGCSLDTVDRR